MGLEEKERNLVAERQRIGAHSALLVDGARACGATEQVAHVHTWLQESFDVITGQLPELAARLAGYTIDRPALIEPGTDRNLFVSEQDRTEAAADGWTYIFGSYGWPKNKLIAQIRVNPPERGPWLTFTAHFDGEVFGWSVHFSRPDFFPGSEKYPRLGKQDIEQWIIALAEADPDDGRFRAHPEGPQSTPTKSGCLGALALVGILPPLAIWLALGLCFR